MNSLLQIESKVDIVLIYTNLSKIKQYDFENPYKEAS